MNKALSARLLDIGRRKQFYAGMAIIRKPLGMHVMMRIKRNFNRFILTLLLPSLVFFVSCKGSGNEYVQEQECCAISAPESSLSTIKIYLETSKSMKGYVEGTSTSGGVFPIKDLPTTFSKISQLGKTRELYTVSDEPKAFEKSLQEYNRGLADGAIFVDVQSRLQNSITSIIDSLNRGDLAMFISDCIVDLGSEGYNRDDLSLVKADIFDHLLRKKEHLSVMLYQFSSDFNGTYYYNLDNNWVFDGPKKQVNVYRDQIMADRPFYIWVFGYSGALKSLLNEKILSDADQSYSYGLSYDCCDLAYSLVPYNLKGRILLTSDKSIDFRGYSNDGAIQFTMGLDLSGLPPYARSKDFLRKNLKLNRDFVSWSLTSVLSQQEIAATADYSRLAQYIQDNGGKTYTHYVTIAINETDGVRVDDQYELILQKSKPDWIKNAHVDDDRNLSLEEIEGKTFGLKYITDAFDDTYEKETELLKIPFTIRRK